MLNWLSNKIKFYHYEYLFKHKDVSINVTVKFNASDYYLKLEELDLWLGENCKGNYAFACSFFSFNIVRANVRETQGVKIKFAQKSDALFFKLTWVGK
jgi:predicted ATPase